jgi:hypothetical protein
VLTGGTNSHTSACITLHHHIPDRRSHTHTRTHTHPTHTHKRSARMHTRTCTATHLQGNVLTGANNFNTTAPRPSACVAACQQHAVLTHTLTRAHAWLT